MTSKAVKVASKAASVFTAAMDRLEPIGHLGESYSQYEVHNTLRDSHAFDQGDDKAREAARVVGFVNRSVDRCQKVFEILSISLLGETEV